MSSSTRSGKGSRWSEYYGVNKHLKEDIKV